MIIGEANLSAVNNPNNEEEKFSQEDIEAVVQAIDEKFSEVKKKIILANFNEENKPDKKITEQVLGLTQILSELAEKPESQGIYFNLADKYTFLAGFIRDFTDEEVPTFPM